MAAWFGGVGWFEFGLAMSWRPFGYWTCGSCLAGGLAGSSGRGAGPCSVPRELRFNSEVRSPTAVDAGSRGTLW